MTAAAHTDAPTSGEDLAAELLRRRRKRLPRLTAALALAVAVAAGVIGGIEIQKHWGSTSGSSNAASLRSAFAARFGAGTTTGSSPAGSRGGFGFGGFGGGGGGTVGTVTLIKGSTLYVTDASGNTVLVHTTAGSRVTKTVSGTLQAIHPGDAVTVQGAQAADGSYTASSVTIEGAARNG